MDPSVDGVFGGTFINAIPIYLGRGIPSCRGNIFGRIHTNETLRAGFYYACDHKGFVSTSSTTQYLEKKQKNTYFWYPATDYYDETIANSIEMNTGTDDIIFTRTNFANYTQIGTTYTNMTTFAYDIDERQNKQVPNSMVELLLCSTTGIKEPIRQNISRKIPSKFCGNFSIIYSQKYIFYRSNY